MHTGQIDFKSLKLRKSLNQFLVSPEGYCLSPPHQISPTYNLSADDLTGKWLKLMAAAERTTEVFRNDTIRQYVFVQRSAFLNFPDYITVQIIAGSDSRSTLAIYSRSAYGFLDFGVNEKRIRRWLGRLHKTVT